MKQEEITLAILESLIDKAPRYTKEDHKTVKSVGHVQGLLSKARAWKKKALQIETEM